MCTVIIAKVVWIGQMILTYVAQCPWVNAHVYNISANHLNNVCDEVKLLTVTILEFLKCSLIAALLMLCLTHHCTTQCTCSEETVIISLLHCRRSQASCYKWACRLDNSLSIVYHYCVSEMSVIVDRYRYFCPRLLDDWNYCQKSEDTGYNSVDQTMESVYYRARSQHHPPVHVQQMHVPSCPCGLGGGESYQCWSKRTSQSSKVTIDSSPYFITNMKCRNNVKKCLGFFRNLYDCQQAGPCKRCSSVDIFHRWVVPLWFNIAQPGVHVFKVCNLSLIVYINFVFESISYLDSTHHRDFFACIEDSATPIAWLIVDTFCWVNTW